MASSPSPSEVALRAAGDGNLRLLKKMARKVNLREARGFKGRNALHRAAAMGRLEVCRFLVEEAGFDADSASGEGETPMLIALEYEDGNGNVPVLRYLLDRGGDPARPDARGFTPLHNAAEYGHCEALRLLLSRGVPVDPVNRRGTLLFLASAVGQDQVVRILLDHGADPNKAIKHVLPALVMACYGQHLKCMKLLVEAGADVNVKSPTGHPVLMTAIAEGLTNIVNFLLEAGADPNIDDGDGEFPIMLAAAHEQRELVEILFPQTKPIPSLQDWSVDGIIRTMKYKHSEPQAMGIDPHDATLFANRSLCWLRQREGELAHIDARHCRTLRPGWAKAWYREGAALSLLRKYKEAVDAFTEALKLDPGCDEIKKELREATEALKGAARCEEQNP